MGTILTVWKRQPSWLPELVMPREPVAEILVLPTFRGELTISRHNGIDIREQKMLER